MDKKFLCILLVASDGYRISLNNSRPLINRLPQIISALRQKWIIASLKQSAPSPLAIFPFFYLPPPPSVKMKSDQLFFSDDLTL